MPLHLKYGMFSGVSNGTDDTITEWHNGFVEAQGKEVANELLQGAAHLY